MMRLRTWNGLERERLETAIKTFERTIPEEPSEAWQVRAARLAEDARRYLASQHWDAGWNLLMAARREALAGLDAPERAREAERILSEAQEKLHGWRKEAVETHLREDRSARPTVSPETLKAAQEILDEHFGNVHRRLSLLGRQLVLLTLFILLSLGLVLLVAFFDLAGDAAPAVLHDQALLGSVMVLGVLGASVSAATAIVHAEARRRVPDVRWGLALMTVRPLVGAASAPLVVILLQSGLGGSVRLEDAAVYAVAVVAGFSERLAAGAVERLARAIES